MIEALFTSPGEETGSQEIRSRIYDVLSDPSPCDIAVAYFTDAEIAQRIIRRGQSGYATRVLLNLTDILRTEDQSQSEIKVSKALISIFESLGRQAFSDEGVISIKTLGINRSQNSNFTQLHHKFILNSSCCAFGSLNFTTNAFLNNYENFVFSNDASLIRSFQAEFEKLWITGNSFFTQNGKLRSISCPDCGDESGVDFESYGAFCIHCGHRFAKTGF